DIADIPGIVGADLTRPFDQREIIARLVDGSEFHEFKPLYGATLVCGFAHIHGLPIRIIAKNSAKLVYAVANARVPRYTVVTGGSYGAGNYGMSGRGFRPRFMFMWPNAPLGTMSPGVGSSVLMDLRRSSISRNPASDADLAEHELMLRNMFGEHSDPYYCTARLWDDGL